MKKIICFVAAAVCAMALAACGSDAATTTAAPETTVAETTTEAAPGLKAGTYTASAQGMGTVTVTVTIDEAGVITNIDLDLPGETQGLGDVGAQKVVERILEAQSAEVDIVSGASMSSKAVITAVTDCLAQAQ